MEKRTMTVGELQSLLDSFKQKESEEGTFNALRQTFTDAFRIGFEAGQKYGKTLQLMESLTPEQLTALIEFLEVLQADKAGNASETDVMRCIQSLPEGTAKRFTDLLSALKE